MKKNIGLVFIGTSRYADFFPRWYEAVSSNLLNDCEKTIFAFSDRVEEDMFKKDDVVRTIIPHHRWPFVTLLRFKFIKASLEEMKKRKIDDVLFLDADLFPLEKIDYDTIFGDGTKPIVGVQHPGNFENPEWNAFIVEGDSNANILKSGEYGISYLNDKLYHQGCLLGGELSVVEKMINELELMIDGDSNRNMCADWHDESHMNCWFLKNYDLIRTLPCNFAWPDQHHWHKVLTAAGLTPMMLHVDKPHSEFPRFMGGKPDISQDSMETVIENLNAHHIQIPFMCASCRIVETRELDFTVLQEWSISIDGAGTGNPKNNFCICESCLIRLKQEEAKEKEQ